MCYKNVVETMWKLADSLPESNKPIWVKEFCEVVTCTNGNHHVPGIPQSNLFEYDPPFTLCLERFCVDETFTQVPVKARRVQTIPNYKSKKIHCSFPFLLSGDGRDVECSPQRFLPRCICLLGLLYLGADHALLVAFPRHRWRLSAA